MKRLIALSIFSTLLLAACGPKLTVADQDALNTYPELEGPIWAWQAMVDAADDQDCAAFLNTMRLTLKLEESVCPDVWTYFDKEHQIDWSRSEWSADGGKVKIYEEGKGSITSFILNTATNEWRSDSIFWE